MNVLPIAMVAVATAITMTSSIVTSSSSNCSSSNCSSSNCSSSNCSEKGVVGTQHSLQIPMSWWLGGTLEVTTPMYESPTELS